MDRWMLLQVFIIFLFSYAATIETSLCNVRVLFNMFQDCLYYTINSLILFPHNNFEFVAGLHSNMKINLKSKPITS